MAVTLFHSTILLGGLLLIVAGFWGSRQEPSYLTAFVSWGAPIGLIVSLMGILLLLIPGFFN